MSDENIECDIESIPKGGRRTEAAKRRTKFNAVKRGLFAKTVLLTGESASQYSELRRGLWEEFQPQTASAEEDVEYLATLYWQRRRIHVAERAEILDRTLYGIVDLRNKLREEAWVVCTRAF